MIREYFSHDYNARNDKKLVKLFMKHGLAGIGAFWSLIEMLYESNGIIKRSECERIAFEMRTDYEFINSIIFDFDLFESDEIVFWSNSVNSRLLARNEKSEKAKASALARWERKNNDANALRTYCDGNANKDKDKDKDKDKELLGDESPITPRRTKFIKPTIEEIQAYCLERKNNIDPNRFFDFYESKGWKVGNSSMKDWKASIRTWEQKQNNELNFKNNGTKQSNKEAITAKLAEIERRFNGN